MTKQQIMSDVTSRVTDEETLAELLDLVSDYPDGELSSEMMNELAGKVDAYVAENVMFQKAMSDLASSVEESADNLAFLSEDAVRKTATRAYDDAMFATSLMQDE